MKKTVLIRGPVLTQSGYGVHSRQAARWLLNKPNLDVRFNVTPWGDTPFILDEKACNGLVGEVFKRTVPANFKADVSFQVQLPNEWDPRLSSKNVGISAVVETDRSHPQWVEACNRMDAVVVPSDHARASLTNTGAVTKPLVVVPEAYSDAIVRTSSRAPTSFRFSTPFNFLVFGQLTGNNPFNDRKNTYFTVKWLCEAFKDDKNVGIVLKTNMGRNSRIDRTNTLNLVRSLVSEVRKGPYPKIHLLHGDMSDDEVADLYTDPSIWALITLTRGEGFGLPILESAASALPIIATGWSGHMDFLKHGKFINIFYQLNTIHPSRVDNKIFMQGARWADASEDDFKKKVTKFRGSASMPKLWAQELATRVQELYSFDSISKAYDAALGEFVL